MAEDRGNGFAWFLAGIGVGALLGVLYAPKSGEETRRILREKAEEGRDYVNSQTRRAREQAGDWVDRGREVYGKQKDQFVQAVEAGRQAYREATSEGAGKKS